MKGRTSFVVACVAVLLRHRAAGRLPRPHQRPPHLDLIPKADNRNILVEPRRDVVGHELLAHHAQVAVGAALPPRPYPHR